MNILKELTTFFKISSHKERRTARSLPHHAADATLTSVALTSTTASLLLFRTSLTTKESEPPAPCTRSVRSQPRLHESGALPFPVPYIQGFIRVNQTFNSTT